MQICEYFFENACYSVTKYYLCKQNNKRSLLGRKQRHQVARSFPNRYLFSLTNKVTSLFPISCILEIIFTRKGLTARFSHHTFDIIVQQINTITYMLVTPLHIQRVSLPHTCM